MREKKYISQNRLSDLLAQYNMTARELSERSGVGESSISQYLSGTHAPSNISSGKMAKVFGVDPLWLMGYDVEMSKSEGITISSDKTRRDLAASELALRYATLLQNAGFELSMSDFEDMFRLSFNANARNGLAITINSDDVEILNRELERVAAETTQNFIMQKWKEAMQSISK